MIPATSRKDDNQNPIPSIVNDVMGENSPFKEYPKTIEEVKFVNDLPEKEIEYKKIITSKKEQYTGLTIAGIDDKDGYKAVDIARKEMKVIRIGVEKYCKQLRDNANKFSKAVIAKENEIVRTISEIESELQAKTDVIDAEVSRIKAEKDAAEKAVIQARVDAFKQYGVTCGYLEMQLISEDDYGATLEKAKTGYETEQKRLADLEAERLAEIQRQEEIRIANEKESARLEALRNEQEAKEAEIKAEQNKLFDQKKEYRIGQMSNIGMAYNPTFYVFEHENLGIRLSEIMNMEDDGFRKQMVFFEKSISEKKEVAKERADQLSAEKAKKAEEEKQLAIDKALRDEEEKRLQLEKDKEAKRIADEEAAKELAEQAPDKQKLKTVLHYLVSLKPPVLKSKKANTALDKLRTELNAPIMNFKSAIEKL